MKNKLAGAVLAVAVIFCGVVSPSYARVVDKVMATVNGEVILASEYEKKLKMLEVILPRDASDEQMDELKREVLQQMINEKLMKQEAEKKKIYVGEKEIKDGIGKIRDRFDTDEEFEAELARQGMTKDNFKDQIKNQMIVMKLIDQEVKPRVPRPTDEEIRKFYEENEEKMVEPEQIRVRHILIRSTTAQPRIEALKKIRDIQKKVKANEANFSEIAKKHSECMSAPKGGDLGFITKGEMVPEFEKAAFALKVGEVSDVVETKYGFHVIKCVEKKSEEKKTLDEVSDYLRNLVYQQNMEKYYEKWLRGLSDKASIVRNEK